jgi:hypothetical protein
MNTQIKLINKSKAITLSLLLPFFLVACGGGGSGSSSSITPSSTEITVERGPVIGALVLDADGKRAANMGNGKYKFEGTPKYPIYASGGYIDVNRDGIIDTNDTELTTPLSISQEGVKKITLLTSLITDEDIKNELKNTYGLSDDDLYLTPAESLKISAISDILFKYLINNNISSLSSVTLANIQSLQTDIETQILENENSSGSLLQIATASEMAIIEELNLTNSVNLEDDEVAQAEEVIENRTENPTENTSVLTQNQIDDLLFMYQEEKVARDVYIKMYELWGVNVFNNIKSAEQSHIDAVEGLLVKYDLEIPIVDTDIGSFKLLELQELYDSLIEKGTLSKTDALEVGVMIEIKDIEDIVKKMVDVPSDIERVYGNLLSGSYSHLDAFNKVLYK